MPLGLMVGRGGTFFNRATSSRRSTTLRSSSAIRLKSATTSALSSVTDRASKAGGGDMPS